MKRLLSIALALVATLSIQAATFTVNTFAEGNDVNPGDGICQDWSGDCSLRSAITEANILAGPDTIIVPPGTYTLVEGSSDDSNEGGDLDIWESLTIIGANGNADGNPSTTVIQARTTPGTFNDRVFHVLAAPEAEVTIQALTVRHGYIAWFDAGGAIATNDIGALTLSNLIIEQNGSRYGDGGALLLGARTVTIEKSIIRDNRAVYREGGAITIGGSAVTIRDSVISGNRAPDGNGGAIHLASGSLTIERSLIANNFANEGGGAIYSAGAVPITVADSTFSGNSANLTGGAVNLTAGSFDATNVTFAGNTSNGGSGGGIANGGGTVVLTNSIFANDPSPFGSNQDISGTVSPASSNNIIGSSSAGGLVNGLNGNQVGVDPRLGPLADNGGPTQTHALLAGSPAIDAGTNGAASSQDQRGRPRVLDSSDADATQTVDIGAFEAHPTISDIPPATGMFSNVQYPFYFHVGDASLGLTLTATSSNQAVVPNGNLAFVNADSDNPALTLTGIAGGSATITVTVNSAVGSASDSFDVTIEDIADLTIAKTHLGTLRQGQPAGYAVTVTNAGRLATSGSVIVNEILPLGFTVTAMNGNGWTCDLPMLRCSRNDSLAPASSWPSIIVEGIHSESGYARNIVNVSGSGDYNTHNNTAEDYSLVEAASELEVTVTGPASLTPGESSSHTVEVRNPGPSATSYSVSLTVNATAGLTYTGATGSGWTCSATNAAVSCAKSTPLEKGSATTFAMPFTVDADAPAQVTLVAAALTANDFTRTRNSDTHTITIVREPDLTITKTHVGNFTQGGEATYALRVTNAGDGNSSGNVVVTETPPSELVVSGIGGDGWSCDLPALTCVRSDALTPGASYPDVTVTGTIDIAAPATITNTASVSGTDRDGTNNTATDVATVQQLPDLVIHKQALAEYWAGQTGARFLLTITNIGSGASIGEVVAAEVPPAGLTVTSMSGNGWTCDTATCRRSDSLAPGASWDPITVVVDIDRSAAGSITNVATVSGGGELAIDNDSADSTIHVRSFTFTPDVLPSAQFGAAFDQQISVTGDGTPPYTFGISDGALPSGLALTTAGRLSGIPREAGTFTFTVQSLDADINGRNVPAWKTYTLTVTPPQVILSPSALPDATFEVPYSQLLTATGGTMPHRFAITAGALPDGLTLAPNGALSGTPLQAGTFSFTVTATDSTVRSGPFSGSHAYALTVAKAASATSIAAGPITYGDSAAVTVTVTSPAGGSPGGSVTLTVDGTTTLTQTLSGGSTTFSVPSLAGGPHTLAATYAGDANYLASSDATTLEVNRAVPAITLDAPSIVFGNEATVTVTIPNATGTIELAIDGTTQTQPLVAGVARFTVTALDAGTYPLTATYSGDANFESGSTTGTLEVAKAMPAITVDALPIVFGNDAAITVTVPNAMGTIELAIDGTTQTQPLVAGVARFTAAALDAGTYPLTATYSGETNFESGSATATLDVTRAPSTIAITGVSPSPSIVGDSVTVSFSFTGEDADVTVRAGAYSCTALASAGSCTITFDAVGTYDVIATYAGTANYEPSTSTPFTHVVEHPIGDAVVSGDATICAGDEVTLIVELTGTAPWTLTWSDGLVETATATPHQRFVPVHETTVYTLTAASDAYRAMSISGSAQVTVRDPLAAPTIDGPAEVILGEPFELVASRGYDRYQWYRNGRMLANATSRRLEIGAAAERDLASYTVVGFVDGCVSPRSLELVVGAIENETLIATIVGSADGANGSRFRSALHLFNRDDAPFEGALSFVNGSAGRGAAGAMLELLPKETRWYGDLFGGNGLASADLAILHGQAPFGLVHVYNDLGGNGTTGLLQPLVDSSRTLTARDRAVLIAPADPLATRFNIGIRTVGHGAALRYTVRDASGVIRATAERFHPPNHFAHMSASQFTGVEPGPSDSVELEITGGAAIVYGASTDNVTNDPNIQFAQRVVPGADVRRVIPVVGSTEGAFDARFRTSLQFFNSDDETRTASVTVRPHGVTQTFTIEPRATLAIDDLLPAMGVEGLGTADLVSSPSVAVVVRVFNDGEGETSMTEELVSEDQILAAGDVATILGPHDPSMARFNIGVRAFDEGATLLVTVRSPQGVVVATRELVLGPHHFQHTSALDATGHAFTGDESVSVSVTSGRAIIYGVWTDNITNDPGFHVAR